MTRRRRGSGLIEFAFGFSVLMVVLIGMARVAYTVVVFNQLNGAVQAGARYASTQDFDEPDHLFVRRVQNFVAYGRPDEGTVEGSQAPGLLPEHVDVTWTRDAAGIPETLTVSIRDYAVPELFHETKLDGRPRTTVAFQGRWLPER